MDKNIIIAALVVFSLMLTAVLTNFMPVLALLIPLGIVAVASVFFSRGILIFLTTFCLVFTQSPFGMIQSAASHLRWVFFFLFTLHVFGDIFLGRTVRKIKGFDCVAVIFVIYAFFSSIYSPFPSLTLERSTTILALYISVFWIIWKYAYEQGPEKVVYLMLNVVKFIIILSFLMIFIAPRKVFFIGRFEGILQNPNSLGIICAIFLPLIFWQFLETKRKRFFFLFFLMLVALLLSASRNSINASVIALGYFIYMRLMRNKPILFFTSISVILVLVWFTQTLAKEFFHIYYRVESISSMGGRIELWPLAMNLISLKPVFGYGFGVEEKILVLKNAMIGNQPGSFVHNSYLGILLQLGIIGLVIFFAPLFALLFKELFSARDVPAPSLRYALRASLIAGLLCSVFESWVYSVGNAQAFPFWVMVMLLVFYRYHDKEKILPEGT